MSQPAILSTLPRHLKTGIEFPFISPAISRRPYRSGGAEKSRTHFWRPLIPRDRFTLCIVRKSRTRALPNVIESAPRIILP